MPFMANKKFHLIIFGCQMNYSDAERLSSVLKDLGYQETKSEDEADLICILACSVRQTAVDRIHGKIRNWQLAKTKRPLITILAGCVLPEDQKKLEHKFDIFIDIKNLDNLAKSIQKINPAEGPERSRGKEKLALPQFFDIAPSYYSNYRAYVPIMTGCNKFCTYCAVPHTRGREVSRPSQDIIKEVQELLKQNYKEIILLGQNVNSYGLDKENEIKFPELLEKIAKLDNNFWLKFLTSHPYDMSDDLITVMADNKNINNYLHLPVQSGSDSMLKRMNRHYSIKKYKNLIKKIKTKIPDIAISTDLIVGFSGETEQEFTDTIKLFDELKFNMAYVSQYSERSGTTAAKLYSDDIDKQTKKQRWQIINKLLTKYSLEFNKKLINTQQEVLIDVVKPDKAIGKLSNYVAVHVMDNKKLEVGKFYKIKITKALDWGLEGEINND